MKRKKKRQNKKRNKKKPKNKRKFIQLGLIVLFFLMLGFSECSNTFVPKEECSLLKNELETLGQKLIVNPSEETHELVGLKMFECVERQEKNKNILKENMPFLFHKSGNKKAILLIHGFTATPWEVKKLGTFLADHGFTVYAPLLRGHGTTPEDLKGLSWKDWYGSTRYGYELLANLVDEVNVVGFSMGGLLSIVLSSNYPVNTLTTINTPMLIKDKRIYFAGFLKYFMEYAVNPNIQEQDEFYYYKKRPVSAIAELNSLVNEAKLHLYKINSPVLVIQAKNDPTVDPFSAKIISQGVHSKIKNTLMIEDSTHTLLRGDNQQEVFDAILDFVK